MAQNETLGASFSIDITDLKAGITQANRLIRESESEFRAAAAGMDDWTESQEGLEARIKHLNNAADLQEKKVAALKEEYKQAGYAQDDMSAAAVELRTKINKEEEALAKTKKEIEKQTKALDELGDETDEAGDKAEDAGDGFTVMKGALSDLVADGIKSAISAFKDLAFELDSATSKFQAMTGATAAEMKKFNAVISEIYTENWGESYEDVAEALAAIAQSSKETDPTALKEMAINAISLRDTFGFEYAETMRAVNMLMDQFGTTAEEAYNLIVQGAQNGLNKNGDLLDTINEYGVHYKQLGYSADDFFNSLINGADAGTFSVDKLGDAMKEFGIRTKDTAKTTTDAFQSLGYGAGESAGQIADVTEKIAKLEKNLKYAKLQQQEYNEKASATSSKEIEKTAKEISKTSDEIAKLEKNLKYAKLQQEGFNDKTSELTKIKNADAIAEYTKELEAAKTKLKELQTTSDSGSKSMSLSQIKNADAIAEYTKELEAAKKTLKALQSQSSSSGKSIEELQAQFAAGGDAAKAATTEVLERLMSMDDEVQRNAIGVALFGSMWEDLGVDAIKAITDTNGNITKTTKAIEELNKTSTDNIKSDISALGRELKQKVSQEIQDKALPAVKKFLTEFKKSDAIKNTGKVIEFVADNFETLAATTLTAVTVYKTFSAAMKVTTAITATKTAVAGLAAGVSTATKMQTGWNAAMSANPIGAVLTAVGLLTAGVVLLANKTSEAATKTELLSEEQRAAVTASEEAAEAYRKTKEAADEMAAASSAQIDYTKTLWGELQTLADANGKVKESDEARAQFILNELNEALGTEYSMTGDIITNYNDMVTSIGNVIEAKRAQMLLEAYEGTYAEAVKNVSAAEQERAIKAQELAEQQQRVADADKRASEEWKLYELQMKTGSASVQLAASQRYLKYAAIAEDEREILDTMKGEYAVSDATLKGYYDNINSYETASTLVLAGETEKAVDLLNKYGGGFETAASVAGKSKDEQLKILQDQVANTAIHLGLLEAEYKQKQSGMTEEEKKQAELRIENAKKQAADAKDEYYKVGGNMVEGMAKGAEDGEWTLTGALEKTVAAGLEAAKKALGIESPSKIFRKEVGRQIPAGEALGIEDGTPTVVKAIKNHVNEMRDAYDLSGVAGAVNAGVTVNSNNAPQNEKQSGGVVVNQNNYYKQAYTSRIEQYKARQQLFAAARLMKAGAT